MNDHCSVFSVTECLSVITMSFKYFIHVYFSETSNKTLLEGHTLPMPYHVWSTRVILLTYRMNDRIETERPIM